MTSAKDVNRKVTVNDGLTDPAAGKSDRVCPQCKRSLHWSRVYCDCGVDLRTGMSPGKAATAKGPRGAVNIRALPILMRSLSIIWQNKGVIGVHVGAMAFLLWVVGAQVATLLSQNGDPNEVPLFIYNLLRTLVSMELLRLLLVHGTFLSLSGRRVAPLEFAVLARDVRLIGRGATVVLAELLEFAILLVLSLVFPVAWWLASRLFILSSVASLESCGVTASFRRTWDLTYGHGWALFRVMLLLSVPWYALLFVGGSGSMVLGGLTEHDGPAGIFGPLFSALYGAIVAVMTVVAHYEILSRSQRSELLRYWTPRIT